MVLTVLTTIHGQWPKVTPTPGNSSVLDFDGEGLVLE